VKNVSKMTYFVSGGPHNLNSINQCNAIITTTAVGNFASYWPSIIWTKLLAIEVKGLPSLSSGVCVVTTAKSEFCCSGDFSFWVVLIMFSSVFVIEMLRWIVGLFNHVYKIIYNSQKTHFEISH